MRRRTKKEGSGSMIHEGSALWFLILHQIEKYKEELELANMRCDKFRRMCRTLKKENNELKSANSAKAAPPVDQGPSPVSLTTPDRLDKAQPQATTENPPQQIALLSQPAAQATTSRSDITHPESIPSDQAKSNEIQGSKQSITPDPNPTKVLKGPEESTRKASQPSTSISIDQPFSDSSSMNAISSATEAAGKPIIPPTAAGIPDPQSLHPGNQTTLLDAESSPPPGPGESGTTNLNSLDVSNSSITGWQIITRG